MQPIAVAVGDWYFDREVVKAIDCAYPCDNSCHNLVFNFKWAKFVVSLHFSSWNCNEHSTINVHKLLWKVILIEDAIH